MTNNPMLSVDLLPCPHCGSSARITTYSGAPAIFCGNGQCEAIMGGEEYMGTSEHLIESWNRRAPADAQLKIGSGVTVENIGFGPEKERNPYLVFALNGCLTEVNLIDVSLVSKRQTHTIADLEAIGVRVEQPAPVAVVMPERKVIPDTLLAGLTRKWCEGWNEALAEVARLNGVKP